MRLMPKAVVALAFVALAVGLALAAHPLINAFPYGLTDDDAWFYSRIAYNIGANGHATFDGIHPTSGFHLLWGGLLGLISFAVTGFTRDPRVHLYAHESAYILLALSAAWIFASRTTDRFSIFALTVVSTMLMETLLVGVLLLAYLRWSAEEGRASTRRPIAFMALALVPLARIDAAVILVVLAAFLLVGRRRREAVRVTIAAALGTAAQVGLTIALFGRPFSVSSMVKSSDARPGLGVLVTNLMGPTSLSPGFVLRALVFGILSVAVFMQLRKNREGAWQRAGLAAGVCAFTLGHLVTHQMPFWCYLPAYLVLFHLLARERGHDAVLRLARAATLVLLTIFLAHKVIDYERHRGVVLGARDFVERIAAAVPPDGRIYQFDGAGFVGFFAGRAVIDGDGLVNTYAYAERARRGALAGYLDEEDVCYVIDNVDRRGSDVLVDHGGLIVRRSELEEVLRTRTYGQHPTTDFVLYRRRTASCLNASPTAVH
jgi:hypothetical protein